MWWTRREFFKGSAAAAAGVYRLLPRFGLAEQVPGGVLRRLDTVWLDKA